VPRLASRCKRTAPSVAPLPRAPADRRCPLLQGRLAGHPAGVVKEAGGSGRAIGGNAGAEELADAGVSAGKLVLALACRTASTRRAEARLASNSAALGTKVSSLLGAHAHANQLPRALRVALLCDGQAALPKPGQGDGGLATHVVAQIGGGIDARAAAAAGDGSNHQRANRRSRPDLHDGESRRNVRGCRR